MPRPLAKGRISPYLGSKNRMPTIMLVGQAGVAGKVADLPPRQGAGGQRRRLRRGRGARKVVQGGRAALEGTRPTEKCRRPLRRSLLPYRSAFFRLHLPPLSAPLVDSLQRHGHRLVSHQSLPRQLQGLHGVFHAVYGRCLRTGGSRHSKKDHRGLFLVVS